MKMSCSYCEEAAVHHIALPVGKAPENPRHYGTQADERKLADVHFCALHWARLLTFLDLTLRVPL